MSRAQRNPIAGLLGLSIWLVPLVAAAALGNAGNGHVKFVATGPAGLNIVGESKAVKVLDDGKLVTIDVPLSPLETGIGLRDKHMREKYLEVAKYPSADLLVDRAALKFPAGGAVSAQAQGTLKLHGHEKRVTFHYDAKPDGKGFAVTGKLRLNMNDYGIAVPNYFGVTVKPDIEIEVNFHVDGN